MKKHISQYGDELFDNRELSWLKFEHRVLNEAKDKNIPILDRLKFVSITSSNLDEFFMVRVASLKDMDHAKYKKKDIAGMTPSEQLEAIAYDTHELVKEQYNIYGKTLIPILLKHHILIIDKFEELSAKQEVYVDKYFMEQVYPVLTPMAVDASRPFPLVRNKTLNIAALLKSNNPDSKLSQGKRDEYEFSTVQVPSVLPRLVWIPSEKPYKDTFILLEQIIEKNIHKLYLHHDVLKAYPYRIMRNADFNLDEDDASDLLKEIEKQLAKRQWGEVIRLEIEKDVDDDLLKELARQLDIRKGDIYKVDGPIDLTFLMKLYGIEGYNKLREKKYEPQLNPRIKPGDNIFDEIKKGDIFLSHPFETFDPVVDFIKQASVDKDVLAIKQTLYRVSGNSPIIEALEKAAKNGKQVTVLVELKARFDEENNIIWAKRLEKAGCHVIYGLLGLKTHCKIALVVRREEGSITRYVHLGTGNYNDSTAKLYTDCGIFTCSESYGEDATAVFNMLSGYSEPKHWNKLAVAPIWLRTAFINKIDKEAENARNGEKALIIAKMNSLCDKEIIEHLYDASAAGVEIHLIVRGICCLISGIPGVSENIEVRSIVGTFLEHSRIFYFYNKGLEDIYMGSADWMPRNLDRRVEIIFPVEDGKIKNRIRHILDVCLKDNTKAYIMQNDGTYVHVNRRNTQGIGAQDTFCREAMEAVKASDGGRISRHFVPILAIDNEDK
ncbi:MAG: RNA degradosome polyphosphate kinase [Lachnospiraceae bacterium]|nr:RNA degradosome polyphosphate kinase [Lachnospiraceae bacterium]